MLDRTDTASSIIRLVARLFEKHGIGRPIAADEDLTAAGLSSLDIVNLMLAVEAEFDIRIPEADMTPGNFRSVVRIEALLRRLSDPR